MMKYTAIKTFGGVRPLAEALGISEQAVNQWGPIVPELRRYQIQELMDKRAKAMEA